MKLFLMQMGMRSLVMGAVSLLFFGLERLLGASYRPQTRRTCWLALTVLYLVPLPQGLFRPLIQVKTAAASAAAEAPQMQTVLWQGLFAFWALGAMVGVLSVALRHLSFRESALRLSRPMPPQAAAVVRQLQTTLGIRRQIPVRLLQTGASPMMLGVIQPVLLLPQAFCNTQEEQWMLLHELTHFKRHDTAWKLLALLTRSIYWFNPAVYLLVLQVEKSCEFACDDSVTHLNDAKERRCYCEMLLRYAAGHPTGSPLSSSFCGNLSILRERLGNLMCGRKKRRFLFVSVPLLVTAAVLCCLFHIDGQTPSAPPPEPLLTSLVETTFQPPRQTTAPPVSYTTGTSAYAEVPSTTGKASVIDTTATVAPRPQAQETSRRSEMAMGDTVTTTAQVSPPIEPATTQTTQPPMSTNETYTTVEKPIQAQNPPLTFAVTQTTLPMETSENQDE